MKRLIWLLASLLVGAACGGGAQPESPRGPAVVLAVDGTEIGSYTAGDLRGTEPEFLAMVAAELRADQRLGGDQISRETSLGNDGAVVQTSFDLALQARLRSILDGLVPPGDGPDGAAVVLDRGSGAIRAMALSGYGEPAGGMDVLIGRGRPTGSALKPFALAAALDSGLSLETTFPAPECIVMPDNPADQTCGGTGRQESLLEATVASLNPVYVQIITQVGVARFGEVVADVGVASGSAFNTVDSVLGAYPVSVLEMAGAYRTIAAGGSYLAPSATGDIKTGGQALPQEEQSVSQVLSPEVWEQVDVALRVVVERGTGQAANPGFAVAGKTGTARGLTDAWFVGYTDEVVVAVWIGFAAEPDRAMVFPATPITVTGGSWPAQIWAEIVSG